MGHTIKSNYMQNLHAAVDKDAKRLGKIAGSIVPTSVETRNEKVNRVKVEPRISKVYQL